MKTNLNPNMFGGGAFFFPATSHRGSGGGLDKYIFRKSNWTVIYFSIHLQGAAVSERRHCLHHSTGGSKLVWRGTPRKSGHFPSELCWGVCLLNSAALLLPDCTVLISSFLFVFNFFSFPVFFSSFPSQRRPSQRRVFQCRCSSTERPSPALTSAGTPWWKCLLERLECESLQSHHAF